MYSDSVVAVKLRTNDNKYSAHIYSELDRLSLLLFRVVITVKDYLGLNAKIKEHGSSLTV